MATPEQIPAIEKMITKVMKKKDFDRAPAVAYMLAVATGRLAALWRYDETLPEGKQSKGIFAPKGKKKPAAKSAKILYAPDAKPEPKAKAKPKAKAPKAKAKVARKAKAAKVDEAIAAE
jgi:hypothetical protein